MMGLFLWHDIKFEGVENIPPKSKNFIVVSNHLHMSDPIIMSWKIPHFIRFMGKEELFKGWFMNTFSHMLGGFPVQRGTGDMSALNHGIDLYKQGYPIGIFPEGSRSKTGEPGRAKSGTALVAKLAEANILPCGVSYSNGNKFRSKVVLRYGKLIPYEALELEGDSPRALKKATTVMWSAVLELIGKSKEIKEAKEE